ncbi:MAG TPA: hypothetical protein VJ691_11505 [Vicinamibacterales bacterium]|nr:hypothetical protein [Vicinamibacterales bacterium]
MSADAPASARGWADGRAWLVAAALALLAAVPSAPSLRYPLFADDYIHISRTDEIRADPVGGLARAWILRESDSGAWWTEPGLEVKYFRPLVVLTFLADRLVWRDVAAGYRATNLALHVATTLMVFALARRLLPSRESAVVAAALFALHPAHSEAIVWVSARTDLLCTLLYGAALLAYVRARERRAALGPHAAWMLALALALSAKEMAVTFPAIIAAYELCFRRSEPVRPRAAGPLAAAAIVLVYLAIRTQAVGPLALPSRPFAFGFGDADALTRTLVASAQYLVNLVLFVPAEPMITGPFWNAHPAWLGAIAALALAIFVRSANVVTDPRLLLFGLAWMVLTIAPMMVVTVGERFLYLPSIGYCLVLGSQPLPRALSWQSRAGGRLAATAALLAIVLIVKNEIYGVAAARSRYAIEDAAAALDRAPGARALLVADLPLPSVLGFPHAVTLARPDREVEVEILSVAPQFLRHDGEFTSSISVHGGSVMVRAERAPYFGTYLERAFLGTRRLRTGDRISRTAFDVIVEDATGDRLQAFQVRPRPEMAPLLMRGRGFRLVEMAPPPSESDAAAGGGRSAPTADGRSANRPGFQ